MDLQLMMQFSQREYVQIILIDLDIVFNQIN